MAVRAWPLFGALLSLGVADDEQCGPGPRSLGPPFDAKHSEDVCKTCVTNNCRWCPFSQTCAHLPSWFGGDSSCMRKKDFKPVESGNGCGAQPTEWMQLLESNYGKGLEADGANVDLMRCLQGRVERWKLYPDPDLPADWKDSDRSEFSCMSALLREGIIASLSSGESMNLLANASAAGTFSTGSSQYVTARALSDGWESTERETNFCRVLAELSPGDRCQVKTYGEHDFLQLRKAYASYASQGGEVPSDLTKDLEDSLRRGPLRHSELDTDWNFLTTWDYKYTIQAFDEDNRETLEKLVRGQAEAIPLKDHLRSNPYSLLHRVYSLVKIRSLSSKAKHFLVFANEAHGLERKISPDQVPAAGAVRRYDLKGDTRKQSRKSKNPYVGSNGDFAEMEQNELPLRNWQCKKFLKILEPDLAWLRSHSLAEYSFFVEVAGGSIGCSGLPKVPLCNARLEDTATIVIIDYMKDASKKYTQKFSDKMTEFAEKVCLTDKEEGMESWQIILIVTCVAVLLVLGAFLGWRYGASFLRSDKPHELRDTGAVEMTGRNMGPGAPGAPASFNQQAPSFNNQGAPPGWFQGAPPAYPNQGAPPGWFQGAPPVYPNQGAPPAYY